MISQVLQFDKEDFFTFMGWKKRQGLPIWIRIRHVFQWWAITGDLLMLGKLYWTLLFKTKSSSENNCWWGTWFLVKFVDCTIVYSEDITAPIVSTGRHNVANICVGGERGRRMGRSVGIIITHYSPSCPFHLWILIVVSETFSFCWKNWVLKVLNYPHQ